MLDTCLVTTYKLAIRVNEKNIVERVDERYFGPSSLPNPNLEQKSFPRQGRKAAGAALRYLLFFASFLPSSFPLALAPPPLYSAAAAAAAMVALASLSALCPLARHRAASASVSISCCAVATPSSGKGTHGCPLSPSYLSCLLRMELRDWKWTRSATFSHTRESPCRGYYAGSKLPIPKRPFNVLLRSLLEAGPPGPEPQY
jgi:hypothetical protein